MITVNITAGSEVKGLRITTDLEDKIFAMLSEDRKAQLVRDAVITFLAIGWDTRSDVGIVQAVADVIEGLEFIE